MPEIEARVSILRFSFGVRLVLGIQAKTIIGRDISFDQPVSQYAGLSIRIARTTDDRQKVFALRYRAYLANHAINENAAGIFTDAYDDLPTSQLIAVLDENNGAVGSLRFALQRVRSGKPVGKLSAPEFDVFADALGDLMADGRSIASGARFSIIPNEPRRREIALLLILAQLNAAKAAGAKWGIATARGTHLRFYRRLLIMEPIGPERPMPGLNYGYSLLASDNDANFDKALSRFPEPCVEHFKRNSGELNVEIADHFSENADSASRIAG